MDKKLSTFLVGGLLVASAAAQTPSSIEASTDSVTTGDIVTVTWTLGDDAFTLAAGVDDAIEEKCFVDHDGGATKRSCV